MSATELQDWLDLEEIEPLPQTRTDLMLANLAASMSPTPNGRRLLRDFMPWVQATASGIGGGLAILRAVAVRRKKTPNG